jgi:hypothetical protein
MKKQPSFSIRVYEIGDIRREYPIQRIFDELARTYGYRKVMEIDDAASRGKGHGFRVGKKERRIE